MPLARPRVRDLDEHLAQQRSLSFSYSQVGGTVGDFPAGYNHDRLRVMLGSGNAVFAAGCEALCAWRQFPAKWTAIYPAAAPLAEGTNVLMLAYVVGLWWVNGCRIVYTIDEGELPRRFGFAYGTLPSHVERGEERFLVEKDIDGQVWYEIAAFSRPRHWLLKLGYPLVRRYQAKFRRESAEAMQAAVVGRGSPDPVPRMTEGLPSPEKNVLPPRDGAVR